MADESGIQETLAKLDPESRTLFAEIDLGEQAKEFANLDLGRYIIGCCMDEIFSAQQQLENIAWWRFLKIQQLQNQAWRARTLLSWLSGLIQAGHAARQTIDSGEN